MRKMHRYTSEQIEYIRSIAKGRTVQEIQDMFNKKFGTDVTFKSIKGIMYRNKIKNGMQGYNTRFKKGHVPWIAGKKGLIVHENCKKGWFKKGNKPPSHLPVGSESVKEGRVFIKIAEPNVWVEKHRYIWEQAYGKIPDGYVIRFKDGNKLNCRLDNLFMTSHRAQTSVVRRGLEKEHPELNVAVHRVAELEMKIRDVGEGMSG